MSAVDRLTIADQAYAEKAAASDAAVQNVIARAGVAEATGTAHDPTIDIKTMAELQLEQMRSTTAAVRALIEVITIGQQEASASAARLVTWTKVIGVATLLALVVSVLALLMKLG